MSATQTARKLRLVKSSTRRTRPIAGTPTLRSATVADANAIHELIVDHLQEGHLLPRRLEEVAARTDRFVVASDGERILACAELAPLSPSVAEVRSLVVSVDARNLGLGQRIVNELAQRATTAGFTKLCAFAHTPGYFVHMGFSIIPHLWLPEKIVTDCNACPQFRQCGQYAVILELTRPREAFVPLAALHG